MLRKFYNVFIMLGYVLILKSINLTLTPGVNSLVQPLEQTLQLLWKPAFVVSQHTSPLQQLPNYPTDSYFVDSLNIDPGCLIQCRESKRNILCAWS
jgi:hypothetical protein